jgi:uncharacterized protein YxjI
MKLTNLQILNATQGLGALSQKKMGIKTAWKITTALRSLEHFAKSADESMKEIRNKYALLDAQGNPLEAVNEKGERVANTVQIPNDKVAVLNKEMTEFMDQEIEVHNAQFRLADFPENLELEPSVLLAIAPLLIEE